MNMIKKYSVEKEKGIIEIYDNGNEISNNKDILCDKITVVEGVGVYMLYRDKVIYFINKPFIKVTQVEGFDTIIFEDKESESDFNKNILYAYFSEVYKRKYYTKTTEKFKVGDSVYPSTIFIGGKKISLGTAYLVHCMEEFKKDNEFNYAKDVMLMSLTFEVVEIVNGLYYKIKLKNPEMLDKSWDELKEKFTYGTDDDFFLLEDLQKDVKLLQRD